MLRLSILNQQGWIGNWYFLCFFWGMVLLLHGCASVRPPSNIENACAIFDDKSDWYQDMQKTYEKWGVPIHIQLAIIHQESHFKHDARPPRTTLFWFIPGPRPSSAYGYSQALDDTWDWYRIKSGNRWADRDNFSDAVDFIGFYCNHSAKNLGISKWDARELYLAYHEGHGGYKQKTFLKKAWLLKVADKVVENAKQYRAQLAACRDRLPR
ncbi:MAG: lytic transglycosylase [Magnetococcus sp. DMHC-6]